ncbi:MAG TPA: hypothetical protein VF760_13930 [Xanthobacteraceae bacterium]
MKSARVLSLGSAFGLAFGLCTFAVSEQSAFAQFPPPPGAGPPGGVQCNDFAKITAEAQKRSALVAAALKSKADRKEVCTLMTSFVSAEGNVVKFLQDNKVWCGVPDQIVTISKTNHEK